MDNIESSTKRNLKTVNVNFEQWEWTIPEEALTKYGSPHFSDKEKSNELVPIFESDKQLTARIPNISFDMDQIYCANEAFPESAICDPIADLEVWDEWNDGYRRFPYPGEYNPLGIRQQEGKTSSTTSVGVLGEILAGLFAQNGISPFIFVRVIRKWPDFILYRHDLGLFTFLESKAFTNIRNERKDKLIGHVGDCLVNAVSQMNADPFVQVWGAFTDVTQISPDMHCKVTFVELNVPDSRRSSRTRMAVPDVVVSGIAERSFNEALANVPEDLRIWSIDSQQEVDSEQLFPSDERQSNRRIDSTERQETLNKLREFLNERAMKIFDDILAEGSIEMSTALSSTTYEEKINTMSKAFIKNINKKNNNLSLTLSGTRFAGAKKEALEGRFGALRSIGNREISMGELNGQQRREFRANWKPNWELANKPYIQNESSSIWRCNSAIYKIG